MNSSSHKLKNSRKGLFFLEDHHNPRNTADNQASSSQKHKTEALTVETNLPIEAQTITRQRQVICIELNNSKTMNEEHFQIFQKTVQFNMRCLHGLYAFVVVFTEDDRQYILINSLRDYESNHGCFGLFLKKIEGYHPTPKPNMNIQAGGEIDFTHGQITTWNLKSLTYSKGGQFDESHSTFSKNLESIWLPREKYQNIEAANRRNLPDFYTAQGSHKSYPTLFKEPEQSSNNQSSMKENIAALSNISAESR